jgi:hypothetical protein
MIAGLILAASLIALLQFFVFYCRSIIAATRTQVLSVQTRDVTGIEDARVAGGDFGRLLELVQLCPERREDRVPIRFVRAYYSLLNLLSLTSAKMFPDVGAWAERERGGCAYFAAVTLDRRIAFSRNLMAQQMSDHL